MSHPPSESPQGVPCPGSEPLSSLLQHLRESTSSRSSSRSSPAPGESPVDAEHIGRYAQLGEIARGGMGIIFKVQDDHMRRTLAMKVLQGGVANDSSQRTSRFLEEAQVTGQLEHPGIIPVHEMGLDENGHLFFTMRLVKGSTFAEVIEHARKGHEYWTRTRALGVVLKVCEAMAFAHDKLVIHRDLKPANIMVGRFGETYVMDWGLAKVIGAEERQAKPRTPAAGASMLSVLSTARAQETEHSAESTHSTMEGDILGTPAYMPPEQAQGRLDEMGPASDIYSLGAMLYHLLAGRAPFTSAGGKDNPIKILERVLAGSPEALEKIAADAPAELVAICERAMARAPEQRYGSMLEVAEDLHAFMEQRVVKAYATGPVAEFKKWMLRNKGLALSAAAAIVAAIAGLAAVSYTQSKGRRELARNNLELEKANDALAQTNAALEAATELAQTNEELAREQRGEALWQSYRANVSAASLLLEQGSAGEARKRLAACDESQRGWEWHFLGKLTNSSLGVLRGHEEFVGSLAFSPDGEILAAGGTGPLSLDHSIVLWNIETGAQLRRLEGHAGGVISVAFSPSGEELASSGSAGGAILWDVDSGEELARSERSGVLAYHPDGRRIVIGSLSAPQVFLWDTYENSATPIALPARGGINCLKLSKDGEHVAVGLTDFKVCWVELASGRTLSTLDTLGGRPLPPIEPQLGNGVLTLDLHPRNGRLLTGSSTGSLLAWDLEQGSVVIPYEGHRSGVRTARFHPDGPWILSSDTLSSVRFWDADTGASLEVLHGHENWTLGIELSPNGNRVASASLDGSVRLWDGQPGSNLRLFFGSGDQTTRLLTFAPDSDRLAWTSTPRRITISAVRTGENLLQLPVFEKAIQGFAFRADGETLLTVDGSGRRCLWNATTGELLDSREPVGQTSAVTFDMRSGHFATASAEPRSQIRVFDAESLEEVRTWRLSDEALASPDNRLLIVVLMSFSEDGKTLAALTGLETVSLWDVATGELRHSYREPSGLGGLVQDAERGEIVSIESYAGTTLRFYDPRTGEVLREFGGHGILTCLSDYSPGRDRLAVGGADGSVSLWHPQRGEMTTLNGTRDSVGPSAGMRNAVGGVVFSPDGTCIASLDWSGTCRVWDVSPLLDSEEERSAAARRRTHARAAEALLDKGFEERLLVADVVDWLSKDASLDPELRAAAIAGAYMRADDPERLGTGSIRITVEAGRKPLEYLRALTAAEKAAAIHPGASRNGVILGAAHYRMGNDHEALAALNSTPSASFAPGDMAATLQHAFTGLAHRRLGDEPSAKSSLGRAQRALVSFEAAGGRAQSVEALRALLQEAQ